MHNRGLERGGVCLAGSTALLCGFFSCRLAGSEWDVDCEMRDVCFLRLLLLKL